MADLRGFDANNVEPAGDFEPIPAGKYVGVITDSELKPTKAGTGNYLQLTFQIIEGPYSNRLLWARLNIDNPNDTARKIAQGELSALCRAVGVLAPNDSVELHNLPVVIHVRCRKRTDTGDITNEIKGYSKKEMPPPPSGASAATAKSTPPWKR
jgi:hypothetical protein